MAKMVFEVSEEEFTEKVKQLSSHLSEKDEDSKDSEDLLEDLRDPIKIVVDFLQGFMIDMENESLFGYYDYELKVGERSISLDDPLSDEVLRSMVREALNS